MQSVYGPRPQYSVLTAKLKHFKMQEVMELETGS